MLSQPQKRNILILILHELLDSFFFHGRPCFFIKFLTFFLIVLLTQRTLKSPTCDRHSVVHVVSGAVVRVLDDVA